MLPLKRRFLRQFLPKTVIITNFVVVSGVGIKRVACTTDLRMRRLICYRCTHMSEGTFSHVAAQMVRCQENKSSKDIEIHKTICCDVCLRCSKVVTTLLRCCVFAGNTVNPRYNDSICTKKRVAIKMNLLLYRILHEQIDMREKSSIATDKERFSSEKCRYLSYFSTKTYIVGTH